MNNYKVYWYKVSEDCIGGKYAILVIRLSDTRVVSKVSGIASPELAIDRAADYAWSYASSTLDGYKPAPVTGWVQA